MSLMAVFKQAMKEMSTSSAGDYDPARVIGYGTATIGALVFFGCTIYTVILKGEFDGSNYAIGLAGVATAIGAAAGGVLLKKGAEAPYVPPDPKGDEK